MRLPVCGQPLLRKPRVVAHAHTHRRTITACMPQSACMHSPWNCMLLASGAFLCDTAQEQACGLPVYTGAARVALMVVQRL